MVPPSRAYGVDVVSIEEAVHEITPKELRISDSIRRKHSKIPWRKSGSDKCCRRVPKASVVVSVNYLPNERFINGAIRSLYM